MACIVHIEIVQLSFPHRLIPQLIIRMYSFILLTCFSSYQLACIWLSLCREFIILKGGGVLYGKYLHSSNNKHIALAIGSSKLASRIPSISSHTRSVSTK